MARYTDSVCRLCRRECAKLFLKGTKCETARCPIERRPYPPGMHGRGRIRESEYLFQLREKQKCRRIYGLLEKQFKLIYNKANKQPGITGENLLRLLELRLDNVVFRTAFASSRSQARQFVQQAARALGVDGALLLGPSARLVVGGLTDLRGRDLVGHQHQFHRRLRVVAEEGELPLVEVEQGEVVEQLGRFVVRLVGRDVGLLEVGARLRA